MMGVYGATVGAGTLFLPVEIGTRGPLVFILLLLLGFPLSLVPHVLICRVFMRDNPADEQSDRTLPLFGSFFGAKGRQLMKLFFCVAHYPVTLVYAVSLINALSHFLTERLHFTGFNRATLTLVVLAILHLVLSKGRDKVVSTMSALALPFAIAIIVVAASQIPAWDFSNIAHAWQSTHSTSASSSLKDLWLTLPLIAFSLCSAPLIPALAYWYREPGNGGETQSVRVIRHAYGLIFFSILFFVLSCILSTPRETFEMAKAQNLNVLSVIGGNDGMSVMIYLAPLIAILGMTKSFLGISMPVAETFNVLAADLFGIKRTSHIKQAKLIISVLMFIITSAVVYLNPDVINMIETLCGPLIAIFLFIIPTWLIFTREALKPLRGMLSAMVMASGVLTVSALLYGMF
ncbi:TPA: AAA family ATPase [Kluyvera ascorbata]|uniref:AAA family ATPase n=3 Tax=Enterobacterales TaxID=91347 RepID=A0A2T2XWA7_9ENTR|nr:AAA family ATPase [Kluyvera genomosp. 2]BBQ83881.1 serine transporter [Klebsiella sp. WP3-W18-ESBL-02]BBR20842.1 serine transporter [Klebsiella sp. WP3-S18-ESBL-05]HAT3919604.1 AAA family ATPase [Kluyvera ascorbata]HAT3944375.1 AAA family ATPase [Kluyvera ascorbata]